MTEAPDANGTAGADLRVVSSAALVAFGVLLVGLGVGLVTPDDGVPRVAYLVVVPVGGVLVYALTQSIRSPGSEAARLRIMVATLVGVSGVGGVLVGLAARPALDEGARALPIGALSAGFVFALIGGLIAIRSRRGRGLVAVVGLVVVGEVAREVDRSAGTAILLVALVLAVFVTLLGARSPTRGSVDRPDGRR